MALGGISHETNTYCKDKTPLSDFKVLRGQEIVDSFKGTKTYSGGMMDAAEQLGATVIPTLSASAQPSGTIDAGVYRALKEEMLSMIKDALPLDAVGLDLHGAGIAEEVDDLEGDLCAAIRGLVGPDVKIVCPLDLHGNITQSMADTVDVMLGVHTYPHEDMYERGHEAVSLIPAMIDGRIHPVTQVVSLPMLFQPSTTRGGPAANVNEICRAIEARPGVIDCTFFHGFPFADSPLVGASVVAIADGDRELAEKSARELAQFIWDHRQDFQYEAPTPKAAIEEALATEGKPIVINETSDNPGGGTPGDGTHLLRAMIEAGLTESCFGFIYDPEVAAQAHEAGVGATIEVSLGGKTDDLHGEPLLLSAKVERLSDGKFTMKALAAGYKVDLGKMARLVSGGIDILVGSKRSQVFDPEVFTLHGIDVTRYKIVGLKSSQHFRAGFEPIAAKIITADSPGLTTLHIDVFERSSTKRPIWPLDPEATFP